MCTISTDLLEYDLGIFNLSDTVIVSLLCLKVKSFPLTFHNGQMDGWMDNYIIIIISIAPAL